MAHKGSYPIMSTDAEKDSGHFVIVRIHARHKSSSRADLQAIIGVQKLDREMLLSVCYLVFRFYSGKVSDICG